MSLYPTAWPPVGIQDYFQKKIVKRSLQIRLPRSFPQQQRSRVLAICCYMADRPNLVNLLVESVEETKLTKIDFVISNNTSAPPCNAARPYVKYSMPRTPKYHAISKIIKEQFKPIHDYVIIIDDDVRFPPNFFDKYFKIVKGLGLILSQPALTRDSYGQEPSSCCLHVKGAIAHLVSFIEIGPVTCFEKRILPLLPFEGDSPMGWGLDFVWARICRDRRWPMGIVDLVPVQHNLREVAKNYDKKRETALMRAYLSRTPHVPSWAKEVIGQIIFEKDCPELS